jgi:hypothetical protein
MVVSEQWTSKKGYNGVPTSVWPVASTKGMAPTSTKSQSAKEHKQFWTIAALAYTSSHCAKCTIQLYMLKGNKRWRLYTKLKWIPLRLVGQQIKLRTLEYAGSARRTVHHQRQ